MLEQEILVNNIRYRIEKSGFVVTGLEKNQTDIMIPEQIEDARVLRIGESAFARQHQLQKVTISNGITAIEKHAFHECKEIKRITLPSSVRVIASHAFYNCRSLVEITMPAEIEEIGDGAFKNCTGLEEIILVVKEKNLALSRLLPDITKSITVVLQEENKGIKKTKLLFPKDNMVVSDFTTRLYMDVEYGVGYHYRQVVNGSSIDYERYDSLFSRAKNELEKRELMKLALYRLCYPTSLMEEAKNQYEVYLQEHTIAVWTELLEQRDREAMEFLFDHQLLAIEYVEQVLQLAYRMEYVEAVGYLLNYKKQGTTDRRTMSFEL